MTTIEKKFESIDLDISRKNFQDLFDEFKKRRDLSVEQVRDMWESQGNEPLQPGQKLVSQVLFTIEDTIDPMQDDGVFDSQNPSQN